MNRDIAVHIYNKVNTTLLGNLLTRCKPRRQTITESESQRDNSILGKDSLPKDARVPQVAQKA